MDVTTAGYADEVVAAYVDGASYADLRERFGIGNCSIRNRLRDAGVPRRKNLPIGRCGGRKPFYEAFKTRAAELRAEGKTWVEIGRELDRAPTTVRKWFP